MKKEFKFSAKFDTAEFDRSIEQMQRKLKEMYAPADQARMQQQTAGRMEGMGLGGNMSKPSQDAFQRASQQARREMDQHLQKEAQVQERIGKLVEKRESKLKELRAAQAAITKGSQEELDIKTKIAKMEENQFRLRETYKARDGVLNQTMDARNSLNPSAMGKLAEGYQKGGLKGAASAGTDMLKNMSPAQMAGMIGTVLTTTGLAAKIGGELYRDYKQAPINTTSNYGSAMTGVMGREVSGAYSGRSALEMAFLPEKNRALRMAREGMKGERLGNVTSAGGSILGYAGAGAAMGAGYGAGAGALAGLGVASLPFAGIGALGGAAVGAIGGVGYGAYKAMTGEGGAKNSALMKGMVSSTHNAEYESMMAKEFASKYNDAFEGLKNENPYKSAAAEQYQGNYSRYLDFQRGTGMGNSSFHGRMGFRESAINAGFTDDMAMGSGSAILGSGGSNRMARDMDHMGLKAGRAFDQTNASQVLGKISGSLGDSQASKDSYIRMLAEGTRQGLNNSDYVEETRRFMDTAATVLSSSGIKGGDSIDRITSQLGGFLADKSNKGVEASKDAFDYYNKAVGETGGPRGTQRAAGMLSSPILSKIGAKARAALASMPTDEYDETDPAMQAAARKAGVSPKALIEELNRVNGNSFNLTGDQDKIQNNVKKYKRQLSELGQGPENDGKRKELQRMIDEGTQDYQLGLSYENPGMTRRGRESQASSSLANGVGPLNEEEIRKRMNEQGKTGRDEDTSVANAAEGSRVVLENFRKFGAELIPSTETVKEFNRQMQKVVETLQKLPEADRAKAMQQLQFTTPKTQKQSTNGEND